MKKILLLFVLCLPFLSKAQVTFARYDFNSAPLTAASIGPDGISINPDTRSDGLGVQILNNCGNNIGMDLITPNPNNVFDQPSLGMTFRWRKYENFADFFERGGFRFYLQGGLLYVQYETFNANGNNSAVRGPFFTGYLAPLDDIFHEYTFEYQAATGIAQIFVDGVEVWQMDGPDNRDLAWTGGNNGIVGRIMDGTCTGPSFLDYAEFYIPANPLPVEFLSFDLRNRENVVELDWITANEVNNAGFEIERSFDGEQFEVIAQVSPVEADASGLHKYEYSDAVSQSGNYLYRLRQIDHDGTTSLSEFQQIEFTREISETKVWPNPFSEEFQITIGEETGAFTLYDLQGRVVMQKQGLTPGQTQSIPTSHLPNGAYILVAGAKRLRILKR